MFLVFKSLFNDGDSVRKADPRREPDLIPSNIMTYDTDFLARLRRRDPETCTWFVFAFTPILEAKLRYKFRDHGTIEDLRNDTFYRVLILVDQNRVREPAQFGSFVRGVCENVAHEHIRNRKETDGWPEGFDPLDPVPAISELLADNELRALLRADLRKLPDEEEELITEIYFREGDRKRMARERGLSVTGLNVKLCRALKRLRTQVFDRMKSGPTDETRFSSMSQSDRKVLNVKS